MHVAVNGADELVRHAPYLISLASFAPEHSPKPGDGPGARLESSAESPLFKRGAAMRGVDASRAPLRGRIDASCGGRGGAAPPPSTVASPPAPGAQSTEGPGP